VFSALKRDNALEHPFEHENKKRLLDFALLEVIDIPPVKRIKKIDCEINRTSAPAGCHGAVGSARTMSPAAKPRTMAENLNAHHHDVASNAFLAVLMQLCL